MILHLKKTTAERMPLQSAAAPTPQQTLAAPDRLSSILSDVSFLQQHHLPPTGCCHLLQVGLCVGVPACQLQHVRQGSCALRSVTAAACLQQLSGEGKHCPACHTTQHKTQQNGSLQLRRCSTKSMIHRCCCCRRCTSTCIAPAQEAAQHRTHRSAAAAAAAWSTGLRSPKYTKTSAATKRSNGSAPAVVGQHRHHEQSMRSDQ